MNIQYDRIMVHAISAINAAKSPVSRHDLAALINVDIAALSMVLGRMVRSDLIRRHHNADGTLSYSPVHGAIQPVNSDAIAYLSLPEKVLHVIANNSGSMQTVQVMDVLGAASTFGYASEEIYGALRELVECGELTVSGRRGYRTFLIAREVPPCVGERYADNLDPYLKRAEQY